VQASTEEVRLAYRRLVRRYHPDVSGEDDAEARIREINEAYAVLADPERRRRYDRAGQTARHRQKPRPKTQGRPSSPAVPSGRETLWTTLADFTKRLAAGAGRRALRARHDAHATITLTLEEAYHGGQKEITLNDVPDRSRRLIVDLPAGLTAGQHLRLHARAPCTATGVAGDLYLRVELAPIIGSACWEGTSTTSTRR
jgi:curved DNA-binding protein